VSPADPAKPLVTAEEFLGRPDDERTELIGGEVFAKLTSADHGFAQMGLSFALGGFRGPVGGGPRGPGGWWLGSEIDTQYERHEVYLHDLAGWRRDRVPEMPRTRPVTIVPDFACEILSPSNASNDTVRKQRVLHRHKVPHYWLIDPVEATLRVLRWSPVGYTEVANARRGERIRAEPFDAIEISLDEILEQA
jgi:Uma2 family endonuclease